MKPARLAIATVALAALALSVAGCGPDTSATAGGGSSPTASPSPSADPLADLTKAANSLNSTSERLSLSVGGKQVMSGSADVPGRAADVGLVMVQDGITISYEMLAVGQDVYLKLNFGSVGNKQLKIDPKKWMKIDLSKVDDKSSLTFDPADPDPLSLTELVKGLSNVKTTDGRTYTGTMDLTQASDSILVTDDDLATKYGDKLKAVPFTATVNDSGQLTSIKTDGTGIGDDLTEDIEFSDFGQAAVTAPTGAVAAPASVYQILNSKG